MMIYSTPSRCARELRVGCRGSAWTHFPGKALHRRESVSVLVRRNPNALPSSRPPSMIMVSPVIQLAASETRNATARYVGRLPIRPKMVAANGSSCGLLGKPGATTPGQIAFTRMRGESSSASCLVTWISAALNRVIACPMAGDWCIPPMEAVLTTAPPCSPSTPMRQASPHQQCPQVDVEDPGEAGVVLLEQRTVSGVGSGVVDQDVNAAEALG